MSDLEGYKYEAIDILTTVEISKVSVKKAVAQVLEQAFSVSLQESELNLYSQQIEQLLNVQ